VRVVTFGESMGLIRGVGVSSFAELQSATVDTGGAEGNVAIGLSRLGVDVCWMGRIGADSLGRRVVRDLRGEGVDVRAIEDTNAPTGLMIKETPHSGSTRVSYYRRGSAGSRLKPGDLENLELESATLVHVTGITLAISASASETVRVAVSRAKAAGVLVSFDVNHRRQLLTDDEAAKVYREVASDADILFAGDDEAALVLGMAQGGSAMQLASALGELGPSEVLLKHGPGGATAWANGALVHQPAVEVDVVDTVGAGDAFVAGYLAECLAGAPVERRLQTAALAGAFACRHPGDWQGAARRDDLERGAVDPVSR
jgi:2-dehydro-3-deoxygluconokinase